MVITGLGGPEVLKWVEEELPRVPALTMAGGHSRYTLVPAVHLVPVPDALLHGSSTGPSGGSGYV